MSYLIRHLKNVKNNLFFLVYLLSNPQLLPLLFKGVHLPTHIQFQWLKNHKIKTIIDVGAYPGDLIATSQILFPKAKVYAFEPIPSAFRKLTNRFSAFKNITLSSSAVCHQNQKTKFYLNHFFQGSSLLPTDPKLVKKYHLTHMTQSSMITVDAITLDSYFQKIKLKKHTLLKIDTQGTEYDVLQGASKILPHVSFIHIESWFYDQVYQNQALFDNIYQFLTKHGFVYCGAISESEFYPLFKPSHRENSLFINPKLVNF